LVIWLADLVIWLADLVIWLACFPPLFHSFDRCFCLSVFVCLSSIFPVFPFFLSFCISFRRMVHNSLLQNHHSDILSLPTRIGQAADGHIAPATVAQALVKLQARVSIPRMPYTVVATLSDKWCTIRCYKIITPTSFLCRLALVKPQTGILPALPLLKHW
jgi:hypothetical protein